MTRGATIAFALALVGGLLSVVAIGTTGSVAGASTNPVAASWSIAPNCSSFVTATPPAGTVSASVTVNGGGGGGGATNSGSGGTGGTGSTVTGTVALTHGTGAVAVKLGCGGTGGKTGGGDSTVSGSSGGTGYAAGAASGSAASEFGGVDGESTGGGGGAASGLCLGTSGCTTAVAVAAGGGGGGARWDCTGSDTPGAGGAGGSSASGTFAAGTSGGNSTDGSNGVGGSGGASGAGGAGGHGATNTGGTGGNTPYSSTGGGGGAAGSTSAFSDEAASSGGGGGGGYTGGGGGGGDDCGTGEDASGGGGGGSSAINTSYGSGLTFNNTGGGTGGGSGTTGGNGTITLTWNVDNLSVTNPGTQSNVSGSAISALTISAPHDTTGGNSVTFSATGLPAGLSINSATGVVSGTPTTACSCSVTVTATDSQALAASTTFTWTITNTVTVTNPGPFTSNSGTAISTVTMAATTSGAAGGATISSTGWSVSAGSLPAGLSLSTAGAITGTPTTAGSYSATIQATDSAGFHGSTVLVWTINNIVTVTAPATQTSTAGTAISPVTVTASDSSSTATITGWSLSGAPPGLTISSAGVISGTPTTGGSYSVTATATDSKGFNGTSTAFSWTVNDAVTVTNPGTQSNVSGTAITTLTPSASVVGGGTITSWAQSGLPTGLSFNTTTGAVSGTPTTACACSVTLTATDSRGAHGSATFTWTITNTVSVTNPGSQTSTAGTAISPLTITATDSSSAATITGWSLTGAPPGLSISAAGVISGTPTTGGSYSVTATATDSAGFSGTSTAFNWTINDTVTVTNPGSQSNVSGSAITTLTPSASVVGGGIITSWAQSGLPSGLSFNTTTGAVSGTPTTAGSYSVTLTATDSRGAHGSATFAWTITNTVSVTNPGSQSSVSGSAITALSISASDSSSTATLAYADGGTLPPGLSIDAGTGTITGTPTTAGSYPVTITVTDNAGYSASTTFTWTITNTVSVTNPGAQSNVSGTAITALDSSASDSSSAATIASWSATGLPPGLSIDTTTGTITGTPTTAGSYSVTLTATDSDGFTGSTTFSWSIINTVTVTSPGDQSSVSGTAITALPITASDSSSVATLTYTDGGTLPPGLSIDPSSGVISGTPTTGGIYPVTITALDNAGFTGAVSFSWTITDTVSVTNPGNQTSVSGSAITALPIAASDSSAGAVLTYSDGGTLPPGLTIDGSSGVITGTPTTAGTSSVTITVTDQNGSTASTSFTWTVTNTVSVTSPGDQTGTSGTVITPVTVTASDSSSTATLSYSDGGTLPPGLSIDPSSGVISGTPTTGGSFAVTITATDNAGFNGTATFNWVITNTVSVTSPGDQSDLSGTPITALPISASDSSSTATLAYSDGGTLPPGLSIDPSSGVISGTPTTGGTFAVTITATDNAGFTGTASFSWAIVNTVTVTSPGDQTSGSGAAITALPITASDSSSTATLSYTDGGTLPPGLSIDPSSGVISGTPTTAGSYPVTVTALDNAGFSGGVSFTWTVTNTVSVTSPGDQTDPSGAAITPVTVTASDSSSVATLSFSDGGTLPPGLTIDPSSGTITGMPTTGGTYPVTITVTDNAGATGTATFNWVITNTVSVTSPGDQANGSGTAITALPISASDSSSTATLSYSDGGTLPPGLTIDPSSGTITGTPTTGGTSAVTITVTDSAGATGSATFNWVVANTVSATSPANQSDVSGTAITPVPVVASDSSSTATLSYSDGGTLPPGLTIDPSSGIISGTPTTAGTSAVTITVTDNTGATATASFTWTVTNTVTVAPVPNQNSQTSVGIPVTKATATDSQTSPEPVFTWTATGLPPGLFIRATNGGFGGTPTTAGTYSVTVTATDQDGFSGSTSFTWTVVDNAPTITSVRPSSGPGAGGTRVKIVGTRFFNVQSVDFGSVAARSFRVNKKGTKITAVSPTEASGTVDIVVTTSGGTNTPAPADQFTFGGPVVSSVAPSSGPASGGTQVSIAGTSLNGATAVSFGSDPAASFSAAKNGKKITAIAPAESTGTVSITVTTPGGTTTVSNAFTYQGPSITGVSPASGSHLGGNRVIITGTNLGGATSVEFGSVAGTNLSVNGAGTRVTVDAPAEAAGTVSISVATPSGTVTASGAYTFT